MHLTTNQFLSGKQQKNRKTLMRFLKNAPVAPRKNEQNRFERVNGIFQKFKKGACVKANCQLFSR